MSEFKFPTEEVELPDKEVVDSEEDSDANIEEKEE